MRFKRSQRHPFTDTPRKRAALRRKQQRERDALPLFADHIIEAQPCEDEVMQSRAEASEVTECRARAARAAKWLEARQRIAALPPATRAAMRRAWSCAPYPANPENLLGFIRSCGMGTISLNDLPFPLVHTNSHGHRLVDLFKKVDPSMFINILKARDIAAKPLAHTPKDRLAAYHHLQEAAKKNKDRARASEDRVLAARLWLKLEDPDDPVTHNRSARRHAAGRRTPWRPLT